MKVTKIIDAQFKTGKSAKGPWTLIKIEADGKEATGFGPVAVGDNVDLEFNQQYNNYSFKVLRDSTIPNPPLSDTTVDALRFILDNTETIMEQNKQILDKLDPPQDPFPDA